MEVIINQVASSLSKSGLSEELAQVIADVAARGVALLAVLFLAWLANWIAKRYILRVVHHIAERSRTQWDDALVKHRVFTRMSHLAPGVIIYSTAPWVFAGHASMASGMRTAAVLYMIGVGWFVVDAFLNAAVAIYRTFEYARRVPIRSFVQVIKIVLGLALVIIVLSTLLRKDPTRLLTGMGAMTAVLMLIFKDSILGFVAGIQLSVNRMIHMGDWIEMPKYGADGDVIDIALTTVKVQNWDKTISTIPTYALISDSFKNWRGMSESGGRRIKR
ncbi:mechanosensitive ion channel family protein, partial [Planctomycetota bacterium]